MRWPGANSRTAVLLSLTIAFISYAPAYGNTTISTYVCSNNGGSTVTVQSPGSELTVANPQLNISASVTGTNFVEVRVDGAYDKTVPIGALQTSFDTVVSLSEGTHEIKLIANDICGVNDGEASIIVTYNRQANPSVGSQIPTNTGSGANLYQNDAGVTVDSLQLPTPGYGVVVSPKPVDPIMVDAMPDDPMPRTIALVILPFVAAGGVVGWFALGRKRSNKYQ